MNTFLGYHRRPAGGTSWDSRLDSRLPGGSGPTTAVRLRSLICRNNKLDHREEEEEEVSSPLIKKSKLEYSVRTPPRTEVIV